MRAFEQWQDALRTLRRHGVRSAVTALSMSWGMLMLVVLLGVTTGLRRGAESIFRDDAEDSLWLTPGETSEAYQGTVVGRRIQFDLDDIEALVEEIPQIREITGRFHLPGEYSVSGDHTQGFFPVRATHPDHQALERTRVVSGRFLNDADLVDRRKVAVIGLDVAGHLFPRADPLGRWIQIDHVHYRVVGLFDDDGGQSERRMIYLPITTAQLVYGGGRRVDRIMFTLPQISVEESYRIETIARRLLGRRHGFAFGDRAAVDAYNPIENAARIRAVLDGIEAFAWLVGLGTILAGVVGVGNIMLISVQERVAEIGLRRAIGASRGAVVAMVLREALVLTVLSGYGGLVAGIVLLEVAAPLIPEHELFRDPRVDASAVLLANAVLIVAGLLAGWVPARRAAELPPAEALRS
ncbi:MAG: ABC transporter permease [Myxococcota bacterium]